MAEQSQLVVRNASGDELDIATRVGMSVLPEWHVSPYELSCAFALDPTAVFLGQLNDDVISAVLTIKYTSHSAFISTFVVKKEHRGKGYGRLTWDAAWKTLDGKCSIGLDAVTAMVPKYQGLGFHPVWDTVVASLSIEKIVTHFANVENPSIVIKAIRDIKVEELSSYDASVFGTERGKFLEKWVNIPGSLGWVAVSIGGSIMGYVVVRQVFSGTGMELGLLSVGPLYADDDVTAKLLLKVAAETYMTNGVSGDDKLEMLCSDGGEYGRHGLQLIAGIEATPPSIIGPRMYKNGIPPGRQLQKIYGTTSPAFD